MNIKYIFSEGRFLLSSLSLKRFSNAISALLSYVLSIISHRPVIWGLPYSCSIEPTNHCNLHCPECPSGMGTLKRKRGEISLEDFKILIDAIKHHTTFLTLYLQGEPLLNRNLAEMIRYASEERIYTTISTNGQILNESTAKEIVLSGLKKLIVSIDGTDQDSYQKYRRNGSLDKALLGIKNIIKLRKENGLSHPLVILQFIVFSTNENQLQQIRELGKDLHVDKIEIKTAQHYDLSADNPLITSLEKYRRYKRGPDGNWVLKNA
ncbi:MAG: radical SAM protein [Bacteroidales bacterium]|nr:radical SAM protein [Bacteroidales bacterium]